MDSSIAFASPPIPSLDAHIVSCGDAHFWNCLVAPYIGVNVLMLWSEANAKGFTSPHWMAFGQAALLKAHVRKGEHGVSIVYTSQSARAETDEPAERETTKFPVRFIKSYYVYNAEQIEGLPKHYYAKPVIRLDRFNRIDQAEAFFTSLNAEIRHDGAVAYYSVRGDFHTPAAV